MKCPHCSYENLDAARFCANCGQEVAALTSALESNELPPIPAPVPPPQTPNPPAYPLSNLQPQAQYAPMHRPLKDRSVAYILEILPGLFGILGIGWLYAGNTGVGIAWLIGVLLWDVFAIIIDIASVGFGCFCSVPVNIVLITLSSVLLSNYVKQHPELFA